MGSPGKRQRGGGQPGICVGTGGVGRQELDGEGEVWL